MKFLTFIFLLLASAQVPKAWAQLRSPTKRNVEVEWDAVENATGYEVQVTNKKDSKKKPVRFRLKTSKWEVNVKPGLYLMQVRSYDDRGVPGEWSPASELEVKLPFVLSTAPAANELLKGKDPQAEAVHFVWQAVDGAKRYQFDLRAKHSDFKLNRVVELAELTADLPVADDYAWTVQALDEQGQAGELSTTPNTFSLEGPALQKPRIDRPLSRYISEMSWSSVAKADHYSAELSFKNPVTGNWDVVQAADVHEPKLALDISRPSGRYRLKVLAKADRRPDSAAGRRDFDFAGGFKSEEEKKLASRRDSLFKPSHFYGIASYLITDIQYSAKNYDLNSLPTVQTVGGTGRIGFGYQNQQTPWGGFGIADLSGFTIDGQNFQFMSLEGHLTHTLELGQAGLLLLGSGLFYKQLPLITGSPSMGFEGVGKVSNIGPHLGFTYEVPFTDRYGLQVNARAYYSVSGSASTGGSTQSSLSYQYGLLGSYRIDAMLKGYAGYAFRHDQANYSVNPGESSVAAPGEVNTLTIEGNYLNFILEVSF